MLTKLLNQGVTLLKPLLKYLENPYVMGTVTIFIVLYGALAKPELPSFLKTLMQNDFYRLLHIFLIVYTADKNLMVSLIVAFTFMVMFGLLSEVEVQESFKNTDIAENLEAQLDKLLDELNEVTEGSEEVKPAEPNDEE